MAHRSVPSSNLLEPLVKQKWVVTTRGRQPMKFVYQPPNCRIILFLMQDFPARPCGLWGLEVQFRDADNSCLELTVLIYILYLGGAFGICVTDTCNNCDYHKAREHLYWYAYCPGKMMMVSYKILLHSRPYSNAIALEEFSKHPC